MKVLIDTNIIVDVAARREPFWEASNRILDLCRQGEIEGYISTRAFCDLFYILRKAFPAEVRKQMIRTTRGYLKTVIITDQIIDTALDNTVITDFEDALQHACAESAGADYIVTRNSKDYAGSVVRAVLPEELLKILT